MLGNAMEREFLRPCSIAACNVTVRSQPGRQDGEWILSMLFNRASHTSCTTSSASAALAQLRRAVRATSGQNCMINSSSARRSFWRARSRRSAWPPVVLSSGRREAAHGAHRGPGGISVLHTRCPAQSFAQTTQLLSPRQHIAAVMSTGEPSQLRRRSGIRVVKSVVLAVDCGVASAGRRSVAAGQQSPATHRRARRAG